MPSWAPLRGAAHIQKNEPLFLNHTQAVSGLSGALLTLSPLKPSSQAKPLTWQLGWHLAFLLCVKTWQPLGISSFTAPKWTGTLKETPLAFILSQIGDTLDSKVITPAHPKGNQPCIFIGRTDAEAETPVFWLPDVKSQLIGKGRDAGKD